MSTTAIPNLTIEKDPADPKHGILSLRCEVDADVEVTHSDGTVTAIQLRAGVVVRQRLEHVVNIQMKTYASGNRAPRN